MSDTNRIQTADTEAVAKPVPHSSVGPRNRLRGGISGAWADEALVSAIREGRKSPAVSRAAVKRVLHGKR